MESEEDYFYREEEKYEYYFDMGFHSDRYSQEEL